MIDSDKLANEYRPNFFHEFVSQGIGSPVDVIKSIISKNLHSQIGNTILLGASGCGKSSLARLYAMATLCHNRQEGECEPCGYCPVCLGEDTSNISHFTIHNSTSAWEPIRNLVDLSKQNPTISKEGIRADQFRRFIILDEIQNASPELLALLYDALEYAPASTSWILISMDIHKLISKNAATAEAITGRGAELHLPSFSDEVIAKNLVKRVSDLSWDAALATAKLSAGNMRKAWQNLAMFSALVPMEELTEEIVLCSRTGGATQESRLEMWTALSKGDGATVKGIVEGWCSNAADIKLVGSLLQMDVVKALDNPSAELQSLLASLGRWYTGLNYPLVTVLMTHLGTNVIQFPTKEEREERSKQKVIITSNLSVDEVIAQQKVKAISNTKGIPPIIVATTYKELILHYDRN